jgi:hypothetical protein
MLTIAGGIIIAALVLANLRLILALAVFCSAFVGAVALSGGAAAAIIYLLWLCIPTSIIPYLAPLFATGMMAMIPALIIAALVRDVRKNARREIKSRIFYGTLFGIPVATIIIVCVFSA